MFWKTHGDDLYLIVRVTPQASKDAVEKPEQDSTGRFHLKVRVRAIPDKGKANKAVETLLSRHFDIPKSKLAVVKGATDRLKTIRIIDGASFTNRLQDIYGGSNGN